MDLDVFVQGIKDIHAKCDPTMRSWAWYDCNMAFAPDSGLSDEQKSKELFIYLANWGMVARGSIVMQRTWRILVEVVQILSNEKYSMLRNPEIETVEQNMAALLDLYGEIDKYLASYKKELLEEQGKETDTESARHVSLTLITKIMLGAMGCTVAYDTQVREKLPKLSEIGAPATFNENSVRKLCEFYKKNAGVFDPLRKELATDAPITCPPFKILDLGMWAYELPKEQQQPRGN